ncbi:hypothetical protein CMEL01_00951 [Colletotrichum melonis]|uniref:Uncharacterized protein n=1 Tax=Colletotrichum melonis TaxID=1209925 RepID=A0AAI9Y1Q2_9PEZI|nr:hypothetical protein CMEL01_00951 [Colletotrichum melonis]
MIKPKPINASPPPPLPHLPKLLPDHRHQRIQLLPRKQPPLHHGLDVRPADPVEPDPRGLDGGAVRRVARDADAVAMTALQELGDGQGGLKVAARAHEEDDDVEAHRCARRKIRNRIWIILW